jgi:hypothetical protein
MAHGDVEGIVVAVPDAACEEMVDMIRQKIEGMGLECHADGLFS